MPRSCRCSIPHRRLRVVLTGGPGAGKTAVLELLRQSICEHVTLLQEAAGIVFRGGFPRGGSTPVQRAAQRAIYHVQRELEAAGEAAGTGILLCDRGTVDGAAYWPGPGSLWDSVRSLRAAELKRYDAVIHLLVPDEAEQYTRNQLRVETLAEARQIDERIASAWRGHDRVYIVAATPDFMRKAARVMEILRELLPPCCLPAPAAAPLHSRGTATTSASPGGARRARSRTPRTPSRV